jgi:hypothetical protein
LNNTDVVVFELPALNRVQLKWIQN